MLVFMLLMFVKIKIHVCEVFHQEIIIFLGMYNYLIINFIEKKKNKRKNSHSLKLCFLVNYYLKKKFISETDVDTMM